VRPKLIGLTGPMEGSVVPIDGAVSIGRAASNRVSLADPAVAPRHCVVAALDGDLILDAADPAAPAYVNGLPAGHQPLHDGDRVRIGDSVFVVDLRESADAAGVPAAIRESRRTRIVAQLHREDVLSAAPLQASRASATRDTGDLRALARLATALTGIRGIVELERPLLALIFDAIPARRGTIVLVDDSAADGASTSHGYRLRASAAIVALNERVLDRVLDAGVAVIAREDAAEGRGSTMTTILAAPLVAFNRVLGAIYLESDGEVVAFDRGHLRLLSVIAGITAVALENARHMDRLERHNRRLEAAIAVRDDLVGASAPMLALHDRIDRIARSDASVLLEGESGTGKEVVARAIHRNSTRAARPFVAINCAAIPEALLESELFGHERGAFTGAAALKQGKLELADGGTVLLDEIGELPLALQAKLLRVLQDREFERVGGTRRLRVDFRLVSATNRDLQQAVRGGAFRDDLYYRIAVVTLKIAPLRERREDIPLLAAHFLRLHAATARRAVSGFSPEALACLTEYDWPGNVRELDHAVQHAVLLGSADAILVEDLPDAVIERAHRGGPRSTAYRDAVREAKKQLVLAALQQTNHNHAAAARRLAVHPNYLHRLIRTLNLRRAARRG
jgi:two-component system, NtrC family, response regulator HydG